MIGVVTCLFVFTFQIDSELWPDSCFDIAGEMSYSEAATAIGIQPPNLTHSIDQIQEDIAHSPGNIVLWKFYTDTCIRVGDWKHLYDSYYAGLSSKPNENKQLHLSKNTAIGYCVRCANQHFRSASSTMSSDMRSKWTKLFTQSPGIPGGIRKAKPEILAQLACLRGSPKLVREKLSDYRGVLRCEYFCKYLMAESYLFGEIPVDRSGKTIGIDATIDINKSIELYKKLHSEFPSEATPAYKLAALIEPTDLREAKTYARDYLKAEKRSFKARWINGARNILRR